MAQPLFLLALALAGPTAPAPLAPGESAVEIVALGTASRPADMVTFQVIIEEFGATEAAARSAAAGRIRGVVAAARGMGVAEADITISEVGGFSYDSLTQYSRETFQYQANLRWRVRESMSRRLDRQPDLEPPAANAEAHAGVTIVLRDARRFERLSQAITTANDSGSYIHEFALSNPAALRDDALRQALALARSDADSQAAARGLRVVRVRRVSERTGAELVNYMFDRAARRRESQSRDYRDPTIAMRLPLSVDFVLAPR